MSIRILINYCLVCSHNENDSMISKESNACVNNSMIIQEFNELNNTFINNISIYIPKINITIDPLIQGDIMENIMTIIKDTIITIDDQLKEYYEEYIVFHKLITNQHRNNYTIFKLDQLHIIEHIDISNHKKFKLLIKRYLKYAKLEINLVCRNTEEDGQYYQNMKTLINQNRRYMKKLKRFCLKL